MLVNYSDDESEPEDGDVSCEFSGQSGSISTPSLLEEERTETQPRCVLPLPKSLCAANSKSESREVDNQGKVRNFEHERGCWASYAYIKVNFAEAWQELALELCEHLNASVTGAHFHDIEHPHLSLTRTLKLRHHWLDNLQQSLARTAEKHNKFMLGFHPVHVYTNDEKTRTFLSIQVSLGEPELKELVKDIDGLLWQFNLPVFYEPPSFHVSLCWCAGDRSIDITDSLLDSLQEIAVENFKDNPNAKCFNAAEISFKAGNKIYSIPLS